MERFKRVSYTIVDGLATFILQQNEARVLLDSLSKRIRTLAIPDYTSNRYEAIHILSRMCYQITQQNEASNNNILLSNLSKEEINLLYDIPVELNGFLNTLNQIRTVVRSSGPMGILEADHIAKEFPTIMES